MKPSADAGTRASAAPTKELRSLYDDRNTALLGSESRFTESDANRHEFNVERVLLLALYWIAATGRPTGYEAAIAAGERR